MKTKGSHCTGRQIIHVDMDAFYASVEVLDNQELRGKPVIVGGDSNRGVVSAASYEAREYGVHSALPIAVARRRCPQGVFLHPRMARYSEISRRIFKIFQYYTPLVEPISLDEAFLDVTDSLQLFGPATEIATTIKKQISDQIGLTASAGVASSKLVAKIASDLEKPDGLTVVPTGHEQTFLAPLAISRLWGVGKATRETLKLLGVYTIGDLSRLTPELLQRKFGKHGPYLYYHSLGIDEREVVPDRGIKSIGNEETFDADLMDLKTIQKELLALAERVAQRMRKHQTMGKCITLKVKYSDFKQITRSKTISTPTNDSNEIIRQAVQLLEKTKAGTTPVRLLGISVSHFHTDCKTQISLFPDKTDRVKRMLVNKAVDSINEKFGITAILKGRLLDDKTHNN